MCLRGFTYDRLLQALLLDPGVCSLLNEILLQLNDSFFEVDDALVRFAHAVARLVQVNLLTAYTNRTVN